jgi:hypothetical protein
MNLLLVLRYAVMAGAAGSLCALLFLVWRTYHSGRRPYLSLARAGAGRGVLYAFTTGMMPWEKESAARHLPTFLAGIIYHAGILSLFYYIFCLLFLPSFPLLLFVRPLMAAGAAAGIGLLVKRTVKPHLRALSCGDDFISNALVDVCLVLAVFHIYSPQLETALLFTFLLLLVYAPIGKIRHCFFFFYTRILFGVFFGRRGVFPGPQRMI